MTTPPTRKNLKTADDQPFDFNLDAVKAEVELLPWRVHFAGRRWEFLHPQAIDVWGVLAQDEKAGDDQSEATAILGMFKVAMGEDQFKEFSKVPLPMFKLKALFDAYQEYGGVKTGESPGSAPS